MNLKFYEKLTISIIIFLGVTIATGYIVGTFVSTKKATDDKKNNSIILDSINLF